MKKKTIKFSVFTVKRCCANDNLQLFICKKISKLGIFMESLFMGKNTSMFLGDHFEQFIQNQVDSGRFSSASEVVRNALRIMEAEEIKKNELNKALAIGEKSGMIDNFDPKTFFKKLKQKEA